MRVNTLGEDNTAIGKRALEFTSASFNTAIGSHCLEFNSSGTNNIGLGYRAGDNITTGGTNIMIGYDIDAQSATGSNQMSIGNIIFATGGFAAGAISTKSSPIFRAFVKASNLLKTPICFPSLSSTRSDKAPMRSFTR